MRDRAQQQLRAEELDMKTLEAASFQIFILSRVFFFFSNRSWSERALFFLFLFNGGGIL